MLERKIEEQLREKVEKIGGKAFKFSSPGNNGVPDRIVLYKGQCYFVELKKPGKKLRPLQKAVCRRFKKLGFDVYVVDSFDAVDHFIKTLARNGGDPFHG